MSLSNKEITRQSYQETADEFAHNVAELAPLRSIKRFVSLLPPNAKILDLGSGSGRDAKLLTDYGVDVLGIDFCPNLISIAKAHATQANFMLMDLESLDFPPSSFDGAWAGCTFNHIAKKNLSKVLEKIYFILNESGIFYLTLKQGSGEKLIEDTRYPGNPKKFWSFYEEDEIKTLVEAAGFKILECTLVMKEHPYQTQHAIRIFASKN